MDTLSWPAILVAMALQLLPVWAALALVFTVSRIAATPDSISGWLPRTV